MRYMCQSFGFALACRCGRNASSRPGLALVELSVVEQRYRAVLQAASGVPVIAVAERFGGVSAGRSCLDRFCEGAADARHTAATVLLLLGVPERAVMDVMGWSNSAIVKRYAHATARLRRDIADRLNSLLLEGQVSMRPPWEA